MGEEQLKEGLVSSAAVVQQHRKILEHVSPKQFRAAGLRFPSMGCQAWLGFQDQESKCQPLLVPGCRQGIGETFSFP